MSSKKTYQSRKEAGLCTRCGGTNDRQKVTCTSCAEELREQQRRWRNDNPAKMKLLLKRQYRCRKSYTKGLRKLVDRVKAHYGCLNPECKWTGEELRPCCLDFHHVKGVKKFNLTALGRSVQSVIEEINKCTVLCANCHRLATWDGLDTSEFQVCDIDSLDNGFSLA